ncbi:MAG: iron chelate uptake ABC transporter family permease subunit, partial [Ktedonobacteraceae bacterium]|nr:iron chelate uptake ABC transporter family permease subunit [Ktedonobacteraceae bacterium]
MPASLALMVLGGAVLIAILMAASFGAVPIPLDVIVRILLNATGVFHFARQWDPSLEVIIWQVRMPGVIGAALVGAGLAVAGTLFQGMLRNP